MRSTLVAMTALAVALGGCNRPDADADHPKVDYTTSLMSRMSAAEMDRVTTPPAPPQRGPIPSEANAADPATNASLAFPSGAAPASAVPAPGSDHSPDGTRLAVMAQDAAAKAPDTASADEAKRKVYEDAARAATASEAAAGKADQKSGSELLAAQPSAGTASSGSMAGQPTPSPSGSEPIAAQPSTSGSEPMPTQSSTNPASNSPADASGKS